MSSFMPFCLVEPFRIETVAIVIWYWIHMIFNLFFLPVFVAVHQRAFWDCHKGSIMTMMKCAIASKYKRKLCINSQRNRNTIRKIMWITMFYTLFALLCTRNPSIIIIIIIFIRGRDRFFIHFEGRSVMDVSVTLSLLFILHHSMINPLRKIHSSTGFCRL